LNFVPSEYGLNLEDVVAPDPLLSDGFISFTLAPAPPSFDIAGGYSSLSNPGTVSTPFNDAFLRDEAPFLSMVNISGCPSFMASSICCADSGYFFFDSFTSTI